MSKAKLFLVVAAVLGFGVAAAADGIQVPNRLATAKVGEWAAYRLPNGYTQKQTVIAREGEGPEALVTIRIEDVYDKAVVTTREISQPAGEPMASPELPDDPAITVEFKRKNVEALGRTFAATVVEVEKDDDDEDSEWWISVEIPVFGIIKKVTDDDVVFEIIAYGEEASDKIDF